MANERCVLCNNDSQRTHSHDEGYEQVECPLCGKYLATMEAIEDFGSSNDTAKKAIISGYTRNRSEYTPKKLVKLHNFHVDNIESLINLTEIPNTVPEKIDHLLLHINRKTAFPGAEVVISERNDYSIPYCQNSDELYYLFNALEEMGYIKTPRQELGSGSLRCSLAVDGFKRIEELTQMRPKGDQCFVAMSFAKELRCIYDNGIDKAIKDANYKSWIANREEFVDKIDDKIISEIRRSSLMIVDVTLHRQSVYFEAGFAMGLGIPIIWTCNELYIDTDEAAFDTRQYNHIVWKDPEELYKKLLDRINACCPVKK